MQSQQTHEAIAAIKAVADAIKAAKADGEVDWWDLPKALPAMVALKLAVEGATEIPGEIMLASHTPKELAALVTELVQNALALGEALLAK